MLSAVERTVSVLNADRIQCKILVEGANGPTTFKADTILEEKGIVVVPDILINTGGVTVSYFEWLKNIEHVSPGKLTKRWQEKTKLRLLTAVGVNIGQTSPYFKNLEGANEMDIVCSGLEDIMIEAVQRNWRYSMAHKVNLRDACYINAMTEIHDSV